MLSPFTEYNKRKPWIKAGEKYMLGEKRESLAETDTGSYYNQGEWLEEFLDGNGAIYNDNENDDSDNDDKNCNKNNEQPQLPEDFPNNC